MQISNHWLTTAHKVTSPNCNKRQDENDISLIVIHCISLPEGQFGTPYIEHLFTNQLDALADPSFSEISQLQVSSHIVIDRDGLISQYVPFNMRAWHAGRSEYQGRDKCNDFSIGIELEGTEDSPYTEIQYTQLAALINSLLNTYPKLSQQNITGHSDIAPLRKTDPGKFFDWSKLTQCLEAVG